MSPVEWPEIPSVLSVPLVATMPVAFFAGFFNTQTRQRDTQGLLATCSVLDALRPNVLGEVSSMVQSTTIYEDHESSLALAPTTKPTEPFTGSDGAS